MRKTAYYFSLFPLQLNFFILLFLLTGMYYYAQERLSSIEEESYFILLLKTLLLFIAVFTLLIIGIGFLTTFISWIYFIAFHKMQDESPISASIGNEINKKTQAGFVALGIKIKGIIKPFLGHVKGRILFADSSISPALALDLPIYNNNKFIRSALASSRPVWIPDIKEHEVKKTVLYFEDMFRLFSFPLVFSNNQKLLTLPEESERIKVDIHPDKSVEQEQRIETPKRIQGELFNYKNFESGDDIRRIVWKIYAKNKDLVVKIPETMDPYASHIWFSPSFYKADLISNDFQMPLLNFYKVKIRQLYEALSNGEFVVKYKPDQELSTPSSTNEDIEEWMYYLSTSVWQTDKSSTDYILSKKEGIFCVSSLITVDELEELMNNKSSDTLVFFIKISKFWNDRSLFHFSKIFIQTTEHPLDTLKRKWVFSASRRKVLKNEEAIQQYLNGQLYRSITL